MLFFCWIPEQHIKLFLFWCSFGADAYVLQSLARILQKVPRVCVWAECSGIFAGFILIERKTFFFFFFGGEDSKQKISSILPVCLYFYCQILGKLSEHFSSFVWDHGSQPFTNAVLSLSGHNCLWKISSLNPNIYFNWQLCLVVQIRSSSI